jgi:hypothetical protein
MRILLLNLLNIYRIRKEFVVNVKGFAGVDPLYLYS